MDNSFHSDAKIHELALSHKEAQENNRQEINNYNITIFSAFIAIMPIISTPGDPAATAQTYFVKILLIILSIVGIVSSIVWLLNLKRILLYILALDNIIIDLERKHKQLFMVKVSQELARKHAPDRVTKYQTFIPCIFIVAFLTIILYCLITFTS